MSKKIIAAALFAACTFAASADIKEDVTDYMSTMNLDNDNNKVFWGLRLSIDIACPSDLSTNGEFGFGSNSMTVSQKILNNGPGFNIGGIVNIPVWKNLYFEPGANIYYHRNGINKNLLSDLDDYYSVTDAKYTEWGLAIPAVFGYRVDFSDFSLSFFTGPELTLGFSNKMRYKFYDTDSNIELKAKEDSGLHKAAMGWRFGVGATFSDHYWFSISGAPGITNKAADSDCSMHMGKVSFTFGYNF